MARIGRHIRAISPLPDCGCASILLDTEPSALDALD
jgi:hypothetical protein